MEQIKVLIVDDHPVVREGFRAMLSTDTGVEVVGEAAFLEEQVRPQGIQRQNAEKREGQYGEEIVERDLGHTSSSLLHHAVYKP